MRKLIMTLIYVLPFFVKGQQSNVSDILKFNLYVVRNFPLSEELKTNCSWVYAIVSVKTNDNNKIIAYHFINDPPDIMKKGFEKLIGYQFSKKMKINGHPIIFYFLIDNDETCIPKPEDTSYTPNQIFDFLTTNFDRILREDPKSIIFSIPITSKSFPSIRKK